MMRRKPPILAIRLYADVQGLVLIEAFWPGTGYESASLASSFRYLGQGINFACQFWTGQQSLWLV